MVVKFTLLGVLSIGALFYFITVLEQQHYRNQQLVALRQRMISEANSEVSSNNNPINNSESVTSDEVSSTQSVIADAASTELGTVSEDVVNSEAEGELWDPNKSTPSETTGIMSAFIKSTNSAILRTIGSPCPDSSPAPTFQTEKKMMFEKQKYCDDDNFSLNKWIDNNEVSEDVAHMVSPVFDSQTYRELEQMSLRGHNYNEGSTSRSNSISYDTIPANLAEINNM
ncbi:hypothetical protein BGZ76_007319 [Entomortierella beljakovae]|nr:hypothetical protein BGZ76_007319 [Entomortierella beljakovae]